MTVGYRVSLLVKEDLHKIFIKGLQLFGSIYFKCLSSKQEFIKSRCNIIVVKRYEMKHIYQCKIKFQHEDESPLQDS